MKYEVITACIVDSAGVVELELDVLKTIGHLHGRVAILNLHTINFQMDLEIFEFLLSYDGGMQCRKIRSHHTLTIVLN